MEGEAEEFPRQVRETGGVRPGPETQTGPPFVLCQISISLQVEVWQRRSIVQCRQSRLQTPGTWLHDIRKHEQFRQVYGHEMDAHDKDKV